MRRVTSTFFVTSRSASATPGVERVHGVGARDEEVHDAAHGGVAYRRHLQALIEDAPCAVTHPVRVSPRIFMCVNTRVSCVLRRPSP